MRAGSGAVVAERAIARTSGVSVHGADGPIDNTLTVNLSGGPLPLGIDYDGGRGGYNTLNVVGGRAATERSRASGPHSGLIELGRTLIHYAEVAPITDTVPSGALTINLVTNAGPVLVANGATADTVTVSSTESSPTFESITFSNKASVTIAGGGGSDAFNVDFPTAATGLTALTVDGHADAANTVTLAAAPAGVNVNVTGTAGDGVTIGASGGTEAVAGSVSVDFATGTGNLTFNDTADTMGRTAVVGGTQVSGLTPNAVLYAHTALLTVDGGSGSDTFDVTPSAGTADSIAGGGPGPPAFPGDQLDLTLSGASSPKLSGAFGSAGAQGAWLFANRLGVLFSGIDSLDPTGASIADANVNPGTSGGLAQFPVTLFAPDPNPVQVSFQTSDGSATAAAGNYQAASGTLTFSPGQTAKTVAVSVPGTSVAAPTRTFSVGLAAIGNVQILQGSAIGTIVNSVGPTQTVTTAGPTTTVTTTVTKTITAPAPEPAPLTPNLGLPSSQACVSARTLTIHLLVPAGRKIKRFTVELNGKHVAETKKATAVIVKLGGVKVTFSLTIKELTAAGATLTQSRSYHRCT